MPTGLPVVQQISTGVYLFPDGEQTSFRNWLAKAEVQSWFDSNRANLDELYMQKGVNGFQVQERGILSAPHGYREARADVMSQFYNQQRISIIVLENNEKFELDVVKYKDLRETIRSHLELPTYAIIDVFFGGVDITGSPFEAGLEDGAVVRAKITFPGVWYPNGDHYDGEHNYFGQRNGRGTLTEANGDRYEGKWQNGQRHGHGTFFFANGRRYEGDWQRGKKQGQGTFTWPDGKRYEGGWFRGQKHGQGVYNWPNGDRYEGQCQNGQRHGHGALNCADGTTYVGEWQNGKKHGRGILSGPDGYRYEGQWFEGQKHGQGTCTWPNGDRYEGQWWYDNRDGHGILTQLDGYRYEGQWANDTRTWEFDRAGRIPARVTWQKNKMI